MLTQMKNHNFILNLLKINAIMKIQNINMIDNLILNLLEMKIVQFAFNKWKLLKLNLIDFIPIFISY